MFNPCWESSYIDPEKTEKCIHKISASTKYITFSGEYSVVNLNTLSSRYNKRSESAIRSLQDK